MEEKVAVMPEVLFLSQRTRIEEETLRYLGYRGQNLDEQIQKMLHEVFEELAAQSLPQSICREYDCKVEEDVVFVGPLEFKSSNLAKNLKSCERVVLLAATIGRAADLLMPSKSVTALIGLTRKEHTFDKEKSCGQCESTDCEFRHTEN